MKLSKFSVLVIVILGLYSCSQKKISEKIIYNKTFLTQNNWVIEQQPGGKVEFENNVMEITDAKGCTVWFKHKIEAPIKIEYNVTVIDNGGPYDRVSDLNCFWMSNDPSNPTNFFKNSKKRQGKFLNYHELTQYYVGYGGHDNTKTRFRRYNGDIERPLLSEHDLSDEKFMIIPNKNIHITLIVNGNNVSYKRDGEIIFELTDEKPYSKGYFGIRTVNNHMQVEDLIITKLR